MQGEVYSTLPPQYGKYEAYNTIRIYNTIQI
jgi:hypothetical protein